MMQKRTISAELAMAEIAIENALQNPDTLKKLSAYNYDRKRLLEGKSLKEEVQMLESVKQDKYGQQFSSTDSMKAQRKEIVQRYRQHSKRARLAFEGQRGTLEQLQLLGNRKMDTNGLMMQVYAFYSKIVLFAEEMSKYNISPEELAQSKAMVEALSAARQQQVQSKGQAQDATQKRNAKRKELNAWMMQFRKVARIALTDEPQMLETLGILVPTQKV
ncbi:hypothetical protein [Catalinimonas niigatensis]|uniref:hypothetical protein n=1 Tax=Catalinimonas niigatensis TaxID=1397264 RepID=UPI002666F365|nr:hypothetical protein [Catalinimonas niigatensis]WPP52769.1 hypothetical protein PZB72_10310 [Catalinimonas niigatensis]